MVTVEELKKETDKLGIEVKGTGAGGRKVKADYERALVEHEKKKASPRGKKNIPKEVFELPDTNELDKKVAGWVFGIHYAERGDELDEIRFFYSLKEALMTLIDTKYKEREGVVEERKNLIRRLINSIEYGAKNYKEMDDVWHDVRYLYVKPIIFE